MDPPFCTGRVHRGRTRADGFDDRWPSRAAYLAFLRDHLTEVHRLLKGTGSVLLHCDWRTCHHLWIELERLFGAERAVNHLVWSYGLGGSSPRGFARKHDDILFFAQVGDSRGYVLRNDTLVQVTRDQSLVNQLIEAGQLTEEEAETFEHNNIILQALGTSDTVQVDLTFAELRRGDILLLCSDGLSGMVRFEEIRELLKSSVEPLDICKGLTERANQAGGHDNITVIVVQFDGNGLRPIDGNDEPLKYRKYILGDEGLGDTAPLGGGTMAAVPGAPGPTTPDGALRPGGPAHAHAPTWQEPGGHGSPYDDQDRIDIPGTHVPIWMVIGIVLGVIVLLAGTAFLLLR